MDLSPGEITKIYRQRKGLTQGELAILVGTYQMYICRVERNEEDPPVEIKHKIEQILGTAIWPVLLENMCIQTKYQVFGHHIRKCEGHGE